MVNTALFKVHTLWVIHTLASLKVEYGASKDCGVCISRAVSCY